VNDSQEPSSKQGWWRRSGDKPAKPGAADVVNTITTYARQELLGPLRGSGRWIKMGLAGTLLLFIGTLFLMVGVLRLVQEEAGSWVSGNLSWIPYLVVSVVLTLSLAWLLQAMSKRSL